MTPTRSSSAAASPTAASLASASERSDPSSTPSSTAALSGPTTTLPARREPIELRTPDGLTLVGELATPRDRAPVATLVTFHPLPTHGGFMDSHLLRKASMWLPELADLAVLRFNTRGTSSPRGTSEGTFGHGVTERGDVAAAMSFVRDRDLPAPWLVGWSFGTELVLKYGRQYADAAGFILLSPPLRRTTTAELAAWRGETRPVVMLVPEHDHFLPPAAARARVADIACILLLEIENGRHLWVGERQTRRVFREIVRRVNPDALPRLGDDPPATSGAESGGR